MYTHTCKKELSRAKRTINLTKCLLLLCNLRYAAHAKTLSFRCEFVEDKQTKPSNPTTR